MEKIRMAAFCRAYRQPPSVYYEQYDNDIDYALAYYVISKKLESEEADRQARMKSANKKR